MTTALRNRAAPNAPRFLAGPGMAWLLWRQHRLQVALAAVAVALFAIPVTITGNRLWSSYTSCRASDTCSGSGLFQHYNAMVTIVDITVLVPLLIGVFWGATIVGRELENGTSTLAWTQSITRRHWLRAKVATLFVFAAACSGAVSALVSWWSRTHNATMESRFSGLQFDIQGIAPVGYALFAAALGLAAGALWRRVLPAMATTVGAFLAVRIVIDSLVRSHYMAPVRVASPMMGAAGGVPSGSWEISNELTRNGQLLSGRVEVPQECVGSGSRQAMDTCMNAHGFRMTTTYQPASRYWTFQWIEVGIYAGLAAVLLAAAVIALRKHDA